MNVSITDVLLVKHVSSRHELIRPVEEKGEGSTGRRVS